jgi:N-acylneuraminate cytidylyltransferase
MKKAIAIIPARGGSKRLPNKNCLLFGDKPLVAHSIAYAEANSDIIDKVYVSTDCQSIKSIALDYGAKVIDRPDDLCSDDAPTHSALHHAIQNINEPIDVVVLLQPTNPLRPRHLLSDAIRVFETMNLKSLFTVSRNYEKLGRIVDNTYAPYNYNIGQRTQDLEPLYFENGLLYITKTELIQKHIIFNEKSYPFIVNHKFAQIDIDTQDDFDYAEYILKTYNENY